MIEIPEQLYKNLRQSAERYKSLIKTSPDAVTVTDLEGRITEVSRQTLDLHGYSNENELIGKGAFELIAPEDHPRAAGNLQKTLKQGSVQSVEYVLLRKDGSRFLGELSASVIKDDAGKPESFIATTRDITARKRAEAELRASEQRYRTLAESAEEYIFIIDREMRVKYVNAFAAGQFGITPDKIIGKKFEDLLPRPLADRSRWDIQRVIDSGETFTSEAGISLLGKDVWMQANLVPLKDDQGKVDAVLGIARDMSEYKQAEKGLMEKMKELKDFNDKAVGRELKIIELEKKVARLRSARPDDILDLQK